MKPQVCPFCRSSVSLIDRAKVYGRSYGFIYLRDSYPKCDEHVGCHSGTITALGTLADKKLPVVKRVTEVSSDATKDVLGLGMTSLEGVGIGHLGRK